MTHRIDWQCPKIHSDWEVFQRAAEEPHPSEDSKSTARERLESGRRSLMAARDVPLVPLNERTVDFTIRVDAADHPPTARRSCDAVQGLLGLPAHLVRKVANRCQTLAMKAIFQLSAWPADRAAVLQVERADLAARDSWLLREVVFEGSNCVTTGLVISSAETVLNRKWVLQATGSGQSIENYAQFFGELWLERGYNTLLVQGPGAPLTGGAPSLFNLGEAQRLGIRFLETAIRAREIVLSGLSMGGGMLGEAILQHSFPAGEAAPAYKAVRTVSFGSLRDVITETAGMAAGLLSRILGCEMRNLESSRRLSELEIPETIINCGNGAEWSGDDMIGAQATLGSQVSAANLRLKTFVYAPWKHLDPRYLRLAADQIVPMGPQEQEIVVTHSRDQGPLQES